MMRGASCSRSDGYPYRAKDWGELNRNLFSALQMEKVVMAVILGVHRARRELHHRRDAHHARAREDRRRSRSSSRWGRESASVMKIFVAEGVIIGAVGTVFGLLLGLGTCLLIDRVGIPLDPEVYYISNLPVVIEPAQFALAALGALVLSYLATIYPATKAARLRPVDGLRSGVDGAHVRPHRGARERPTSWRIAASRCCAASTSTICEGELVALTGAVGRGEEHVPPPRRHPRRADAGPGPLRRRGRVRAGTRQGSPRSATRRSGSCSSATTCCPSSPRSRTPP